MSYHSFQYSCKRENKIMNQDSTAYLVKNGMSANVVVLLSQILYREKIP